LRKAESPQEESSQFQMMVGLQKRLTPERAVWTVSRRPRDALSTFDDFCEYSRQILRQNGRFKSNFFIEN